MEVVSTPSQTPAALQSPAAAQTSAAAQSSAASAPTLPPVHADPARLDRVTVCTRPFRATGPRIEAERLGDKLLLHNYGHGGSGWSLSWGSAERVLALLHDAGAAPALANVLPVAVIGCGAMGLTAALTLQRAGYPVRIYARDLPPEARSSRATGLWSPDSRFALARNLETLESPDSADAESGTTATQWEAMARHSWSVYEAMAAEPNPAIEWHDRYLLSTLPPAEAIARRQAEDPIGFAHLENRLADLYTSEDLGPGTHPFPIPWARRLTTFRFNITAYTQRLLAEFHARGGTLTQREFGTPAELLTLPESAIVHCTGYGARRLFGDNSLTPVRGQIGWLPAQPELGYSLQFGRLSVVPRGDGIAVQIGASSDDTGWNDPGETTDRAESEAAVRQLAALQAGNPTPGV